MSTTYTTSSTFTVTHARYLASKIAADLYQMQLFYGRPSDKEIENYVVEAVVLLLEGCLSSVTYGFKRGNEWVLALKYDATTGGLLMQDGRSGRVRPGVDISGAIWYSFLTYSSVFERLTSAERAKLAARLPISRTSGQEPQANGYWTYDKSYSSGGVTLQRRSFNKY